MERPSFHRSEHMLSTKEHLSRTQHSPHSLENHPSNNTDLDEPGVNPNQTPIVSSLDVRDEEGNLVFRTNDHDPRNRPDDPTGGSPDAIDSGNKPNSHTKAWGGHSESDAIVQDMFTKLAPASSAVPSRFKYSKDTSASDGEQVARFINEYIENSGVGRLALTDVQVSALARSIDRAPAISERGQPRRIKRLRRALSNSAGSAHQAYNDKKLGSTPGTLRNPASDSPITVGVQRNAYIAPISRRQLKKRLKASWAEYDRRVAQVEASKLSGNSRPADPEGSTIGPASRGRKRTAKSINYYKHHEHVAADEVAKHTYGVVDLAKYIPFYSGHIKAASPLSNVRGLRKSALRLVKDDEKKMEKMEKQADIVNEMIRKDAFSRYLIAKSEGRSDSEIRALEGKLGIMRNLRDYELPRAETRREKRLARRVEKRPGKIPRAVSSDRVRRRRLRKKKIAEGEIHVLNGSDT